MQAISLADCLTCNGVFGVLVSLRVEVLFNQLHGYRIRDYN